jgi:hypothetical protein
MLSAPPIGTVQAGDDGLGEFFQPPRGSTSTLGSWITLYPGKTGWTRRRSIGGRRWRLSRLPGLGGRRHGNEQRGHSSVLVAFRTTGLHWRSWGK